MRAVLGGLFKQPVLEGHSIHHHVSRGAREFRDALERRGVIKIVELCGSHVTCDHRAQIFRVLVGQGHAGVDVLCNQQQQGNAQCCGCLGVEVQRASALQKGGLAQGLRSDHRGQRVDLARDE